MDYRDLTTSEERARHLNERADWGDVTVTHRATGKTIALFRCTQMVLQPDR